MIGITNCPSQMATPGQPQNMDEDDCSIKSPSSGTLKKSTITSFFKPKTPKSSPGNLLDNLQVNADDPPASITRDFKRHNPDHLEEDASRASVSSQGQSSKANRKGYKCEDGTAGCFEPREDGGKYMPSLEACGKQDTLNSDDKVRDDDVCECTNVSVKPAKKEGTAFCLSKLDNQDHSHRKNDNAIDNLRNSGCSKGQAKSSKKRKKDVEFDSSSDDFEADRRSKMPKQKLQKIESDQEINVEASEPLPLTSHACCSNAVSSDSDEDIFEVEELSENPRVISYQDFLNESLEKDSDEVAASAGLPDSRRQIKEMTQMESADLMNAHDVKGEPLTSEETCPEHTLKEKPGKRKTVCSQKEKLQNSAKPNKPNESAEKKLASSKKISDVSEKKTSELKEGFGEEQNDTRSPQDDDSVLTISYSEFLEDKLSTEGPRESSPTLKLPCPKQKLVTIEAQVHTPPCDQPLQPASDGISPVSKDLVTIDLCHSPEDQKVPASKKRTSNVVVSMSDLDLTIVSTDEALATENRKSKMVYSIFQKKGNMEKPKETTSTTTSKKSEQNEPSAAEQGEASDAKPKWEWPRKRPKDADMKQETNPQHPSRKNKSSKKAEHNTQAGRQVKRALKTVFSIKSEEENTEEEFEEDIKNKKVSSRKKKNPKKLGNSSDESQESTRGRNLKSSQRTGTVVITSTPKAKNNKKVKAQQLLRKAKSRQLSRASPLPFQDTKRAVRGIKTARQTDDSRVQKATLQRKTSESRNLTRNPRNLTNVLGRKVKNTEMADDVKVKPQTRKGVAKGKAVIGEVQERKPTKLAPMFTKEGRLALAKKQQSLDRQMTGPPCLMVTLEDDENSRDSIRSDGGDVGGVKLMSDAFSRSKESDGDLAYPPFPSISHVLQMGPEIEGSVDWWKLPSPKNFGKFLMKGRDHKLSFEKNCRIGDRPLRLGEFTLCSKDTDKTAIAKSFSGHPELSYDVQRLIQDQIKAANPRFPVNRVFKRYLAKRKGEPLVPKLSHGETASETKCNQQTDSSFTKLKAEKPSSTKRKPAVSEQQGNAKRRRTTQGKIAENPEAEFSGKIRLRRRSSSWVIRDDDRDEKQDTTEQPKPRRSSRQAEQASKRESAPREGRTLRTRRGKNAAKEIEGMKGKKEGTTEADDAKAKETQADKLAGLPWTEKYQPVTSAEIIGNSLAMKRLTGWLTEWKKKTARIKKKMKRQQGRQQSKTLLALTVEDSDSDFDLGSDSGDCDSDDDDDSLSNAMLIVGPTGSGKTAAVYACAKELGFKVFEVNASSKRTGKQILADLGEATQSHHLSAHHQGNNNSSLKSFFSAKSPSKSGSKPEMKKTPIPKAFAAFYKAGADAAAVKQGGRKTKAASDKSPKKPQGKSQPASRSKAPNTSQPQQAAAAAASNSNRDSTSTQRLTSTSLILFEDVDVVFDEDKGFLAAISTFLRTTKRPIVLTTSDGRFPDLFEESCEMVTFRKPPSLQLATHLQLLCLAENVYASHSNLHHVVSLLDRDVRCCMLAAQFWVGSGAGQVTYDTHGPRTQDLRTVSGPQTDVAHQDENQLPEKKASGLCSGAVEVADSNSFGQEKSCCVLPTSQSGCFESVTGLCNLSRIGSESLPMLKVHGRDSSPLYSRSLIAETFQKENNMSVYFNNIQRLLPVPSLRHSDRTSWNRSIDQSWMESEAETASGRTARSINCRLLNSLAAFADDISSLDSYIFHPRHDGKGLGNSGWWRAEVKPTLSLDSPNNSDVYNYTRDTISSSIRGFLEAASFDRCHRNCERAAEHLKQLQPSPRDSALDQMQMEMMVNRRRAEEFASRPEQDGLSCLRLQEDNYAKCPEVYPALLGKLPLSTHCNHRVLAVDYFPTLRCICKSEQIREETKIKRRFLHYLDSISLNLKKTDHVALCSIMEVKHKTKLDEKSRESQEGELKS